MPVIAEPPPQGLAIGRPVATRSVRAASRSSVNSMPMMGCDGSRLVTVNSRFTVPPGATGSSLKDLVSLSRLELTVSASVAGGKRASVPPRLAVRLLVVLL